MGLILLASFPLMLLSIGLTYAVVCPFYDMLDSVQQFVEHGFSFTFSMAGVLKFTAAIYFYVVMHEMLHGIMIPDFRKSDKTFWGFNILGGFVFTTEELTKNRFMVTSIFPYLVLTVGVSVVFGLLGMLNGFILFLIIINAGGSCVDFLNIALIAFQVPRGSKIINNGAETFYK